MRIAISISRWHSLIEFDLLFRCLRILLVAPWARAKTQQLKHYDKRVRRWTFRPDCCFVCKLEWFRAFFSKDSASPGRGIRQSPRLGLGVGCLTYILWISCTGWLQSTRWSSIMLICWGPETRPSDHFFCWLDDDFFPFFHSFSWRYLQQVNVSVWASRTLFEELDLLALENRKPEPEKP